MMRSHICECWGHGEHVLEHKEGSLTGIIPYEIPFNRGQHIERVSKLSKILNEATIEIKEPKKPSELLL